MLTRSDLSQIQKIVKTETKDVVRQELKPIKRDIKDIKGTVNVMLDVLDKADVEIQKRVKKIEDHLGLPA